MSISDQERSDLIAAAADASEARVFARLRERLIHSVPSDAIINYETLLMLLADPPQAEKAKPPEQPAASEGVGEAIAGTLVFSLPGSMKMPEAMAIMKPLAAAIDAALDRQRQQIIKVAEDVPTAYGYSNFVPRDELLAALRAAASEGKK